MTLIDRIRKLFLTVRCCDCGVMVSNYVREPRYGVAVPVCSDREKCRARVERQGLREFVRLGTISADMRRAEREVHHG